jgi:membrane protein DedA with SNARE-associated domain
MPELWLAGQAWVYDGLHQSGSQAYLFLGLVLTTFLLEDVALAAGAALVMDGAVGWGFSFSAVAGGIALGDLGLYWIGQQSLRLGWLRRRFVDEKTLILKEKIEHRLVSVIFLARVIPGLRLLTYVSCGYLRIRFLPFACWVVISVALWTAGLFFVSSAIGEEIADLLGISSTIATPLFIVLLALAIPLLRKALAHG